MALRPTPSQPSAAPLSEFDRALRAIAKVPKSDVLKMERRRKPVASTRKREGK